jgi:hypothetical protein
MSLLVGPEDWFVVKDLPHLALTDAVSGSFVGVPVVDLKVVDPDTHC